MRTNDLENDFCSEIMSEELEKVPWAHITEVVGTRLRCLDYCFLD